jgi:hypothetical protein
MDQATNRLPQRPAKREKARVSWRTLGALALFLYGMNSTRSLGQIRGLSGHAADADRAAW